MSMTIGRVGRDVALPEPNNWSERGDGVVQCAGWLTATTSSDAAILREQLVGLTNSHTEPFVPVTVAHDSERDGWYQVLDVDVDHVLGQTETDGGRRWSATLRRLDIRTSPRYELHRYGTVWTNSHGFTVTSTGYESFVALSSTASAVDLGETGASRALRSSDTGEIAIFTGTSGLYDTVVSAHQPFDNLYDGAAKIEVDVDGAGTWRTVVGSDIRDLPTQWRIGNGMIRCTSSNGNYLVEVYDTGSWVNLGETGAVENVFIISDTTASFPFDGADALKSVSVLRNDPLACTIRLVHDYQSSTSRVFVDVTARRGDRNLFGIIKTRSFNQWGWTASLSGTSTVITSGAIRIDADDDNANRWVLSSPKVWNGNTSTGAWRVASSTTVIPWAIGVEVGSSSATGINTASSITAQFFTQPTETLFIARP